MSRDLLDFADSVGRTVADLPRARTNGVKAAALHTKNTILAETRRAVGPDLRMSGVGRAGAKLNVRYIVKESRNTTAYVKAVGKAWPLIERDTDPHPIRPKGQTYTMRGRRRRGAKALKFGTGFYAYANHPGTAGKHPFERGWKQAARDTGRIFQAEVRKSIQRAWIS